MHTESLSCPTPCNAMDSCQAPLPIRFSRQEYWSGLPLPFPGELPDPEIEPRSPALQADALPTKLHRKLTKAEVCSEMIAITSDTICYQL